MIVALQWGVLTTSSANCGEHYMKKIGLIWCYQSFNLRNYIDGWKLSICFILKAANSSLFYYAATLSTQPAYVAVWTHTSNQILTTQQAIIFRIKRQPSWISSTSSLDSCHLWLLSPHLPVHRLRISHTITFSSGIWRLFENLEKFG